MTREQFFKTIPAFFSPIATEFNE
ncbi:MAG: hypothetical protein YK1309IOTA_1560004, partial [Marine Group I thaumarchaeote]